MIFPLRCTFCDAVLPWGKEQVCEECRKKIKYIRGAVCYKCGKEVKEEEEYCFDCKRRSHQFERGAALFEYEFVRGSLYRFKYGGRREYAACYGRYMAAGFKNYFREWKPQALVPVPIHRKRKKKRGYNQAELVAEELAKYWKIPVCKDLVLRNKNTRPMKDLDGNNRQNNLKKAFLLGRNDVKLSTVIIIDDIYTTGSTIDAVAEICKEAGIRHIYFLTVSIGRGL
jgi:ComF family protein